jgi:hypothetical protein
MYTTAQSKEVSNPTCPLIQPLRSYHNAHSLLPFCTTGFANQQGPSSILSCKLQGSAGIYNLSAIVQWMTVSQCPCARVWQLQQSKHLVFSADIACTELSEQFQVQLRLGKDRGCSQSNDSLQAVNTSVSMGCRQTHTHTHSDPRSTAAMSGQMNSVHELASKPGLLALQLGLLWLAHGCAVLPGLLWLAHGCAVLPIWPHVVG